MISTKQAERSILEALRLAVVAAGYLPDITASGDADAWAAARSALAATLTLPEGLIDVFGVGSPEGRNEEQIHRIVIDREGSVPGSIGGAPATRFVVTSGVAGEAGAKYTKEFIPSMSEDVTYELTTVSNHIFMDRIIRSIIKNTLKGRMYLETVDDNGDKDGNYILLEFINDVDRTAGGNLMRSHRILVSDLYDEGPELLRMDISSIDTLHFEIGTVENSVSLKDLVSKGQWDASTNTPTISDATGIKNDYYIISVGGEQDLGSGLTTWVVRDLIYHDGIKWKKLKQ